MQSFTKKRKKERTNYLTIIQYNSGSNIFQWLNIHSFPSLNRFHLRFSFLFYHSLSMDKAPSLSQPPETPQNSLILILVRLKKIRNVSRGFYTNIISVTCHQQLSFLQVVQFPAIQATIVESFEWNPHIRSGIQ